MPMAPPRMCPSCSRTFTADRCPSCTRRRDLARGSALARGYDDEWAAYSRTWLRHHPWCGERADGQLHAEHSRCVQHGERTPAAVTDHIVALRHGGARLDPQNHQSLCRGCNVAKDAARGHRW